MLMQDSAIYFIKFISRIEWTVRVNDKDQFQAVYQMKMNNCHSGAPVISTRLIRVPFHWFQLSCNARAEISTGISFWLSSLFFRKTIKGLTTSAAVTYIFLQSLLNIATRMSGRVAVDMTLKMEEQTEEVEMTGRVMGTVMSPGSPCLHSYFSA